MSNRESAFSPGEAFGPYEIVQLLGKGGMGEVYLIKHRKTGGLFALKIMTPPEGKNGHEWRLRFAREAEFAMKIRHANLIGVYDIGEDPDTHLCYIIMEYVPNGTLSGRLKAKGKFSVQEAVSIAAQVASALDVAHKEGVVHRDIKPDNIMFDANGVPKIADLGIAKFAKSNEDATVTKTGAIIGTPAYMSPEQMMDSHHVDARADIYSLGIVLYEMLTGARPNADSTIVALLAKAVNGEELPDVREMRPEISAAVAYVLSRLVAPKPEDRPNTALEAATLLKNAATGHFKVPKEFRRNRASAEAARRKKRRIAFVAVAALAVLALAGAGIAVAKFSPGGREATHGPTDKTIRRTKVGEHIWSYWLLDGEAVLRGEEQIGDGQFSCCVLPNPEGKLVVPSQLDGYKVAVLDVGAFKDCDKMTAIELPEGIREIRVYAFKNCSMVSEVALPKSVRKITAPFWDCQALKRLNLGLCEDLFAEIIPCEDCQSLERIDVDSGNPAFASHDGALYSKDAKRLILYPDAKSELKLPKGLETIGNGAFQHSCLKAISIPEGVKTVLGNAFHFCEELEVLEFPKSIETIRAGAIGSAAAERLKKIVFHGDAPEDTSFMLQYGLQPELVIEVERGTKGWDGDKASTRLPEKWPMRSGAHSYEIRYIGETAAEAAAGLDAGNKTYTAQADAMTWTYMLHNGNAVLIYGPTGPCVSPAPSGALNVPSELAGHKVVEIGNGAFSECKNLTEVRLPDGVKRIGTWAFNNCESMKRLYIPKSVESIDTYAFRFCTSLQEIRVDPANETFKSVDGALYLKTGELLTYPKNRSEIRIRAGTEIVGTIAFAHASYRNVKVPDGVKQFGFWMFEACKNLETVELPKTLEDISAWTFKDCTSLSKVVFHGNAPRHGDSIFMNAPENLIVEVPRGSLGWNGAGSTSLPAKWPANAGKDARRIRYIDEADDQRPARPRTVAANVRTAMIGKVRWFYMLEDGKAVLQSGNDVYSNEACIEPLPSGKVVVPAKIDGYPVVALGACAFNKCAKMTEIVIPEGVKEIRGEFCFNECSALKEIKFPKSIVRVLGHAFRNCSSLRKIDISQCKAIGGDAFMGCSSLDEIVAADDNAAFASKDGALYSKDGKTLVAYPKARDSVKLPRGVRLIGDCALAYGRYERVALPEGVKIVSRWAFEYCRELETVELPRSLSELWRWAFKECNNLRKVVFHGNAPFSDPMSFAGSPSSFVVEVERDSTGWSTAGSATLPARWPTNAKENSREICHIGEERKFTPTAKDAVVHSSVVGNYLWFYSLEDGKAILWRGSDASSGEPCVEPKPHGRIEVPETINGHPVVALGSLAFSRCEGMTGIVLPKTLKAIGNRAFLFCTSLKEIDMPDNVEWIGKWALNRCHSIKRINIGKCSAFPDPGVFSHCPSLEKFEASPDNKAFKVIDGSLYSKDGKRFVAFAGAGQKCIIAKGVESVDSYAFGGSCVERVLVPASVKVLNEGIFHECRALKTVRFAGAAPEIAGQPWSIFHGANDSAVIEARAGSEGWGGDKGVSFWPENNPRRVVLVDPKGRAKPKKK